MNNGLIAREKWIDALKGVAIILVVLGHVIDGFIKSGFEYNGVTEIRVYDGIYIFHMPFFFAISGYVFAMVYLSSHSDWGGDPN